MTRSSRPPTSAAPSGATVSGVLLAATVALLVVRWLIPAEAAESGEQLWIAAAWSLLAGVWLWLAPTPRRRWDWVDACLALLILGHELGGLLVFVTGGQLRFAANLMCEWWGLACAWLVLRDVMPQPFWCGPLRRALLATAATAACLGIYQHYWGLPQSVRVLMPLIERHRAGDNTAARELSKLGVPNSEPGLTLYEKRLRDSREPFGFFALANTLGGLLAASLVWGMSVFFFVPPFQGGIQGGCAQVDARSSSPPPSPPWQRGRMGIVLIALAWCLALTKSRTAWVGAGCGVACLVWQMIRSRSRVSEESQLRRGAGSWIAASAMGLVLLAAATWGLTQTGGLDSQVLLESAKSLSYRGHYWIGAGRLIAESPIFGRGLGQFREHYLRVKLPEASEEIADPHNLLLDAWVNGGLCAVVGLIGLFLAVARAPRPLGSSLGAVEMASNASPTKFVFIGGVLGFVVAFLAGLWLNGEWDDRYLVLGAAWCALFWVLPSQTTESAPGAVAAVVTLGVHLLGAGGLGMPGVMQMAFVWLAGATATKGDPAPNAQRIARAAAVIAVVGSLVVACAVWRPVMAAQQALARGDAAAQRADLHGATIAYELASAADPWNPTAPGRLAELEFDQFRRLSSIDHQATSADSEPFQRALAHLDEAQQRGPFSVIWTRRRAELWLVLFERSHDPTHAARAAELFHSAVSRYPTNAELLALLSDALVHAGDIAASATVAQRALTQDDLNQRLGHVERVLPAATRLRLEGRTTSSNSRNARTGVPNCTRRRLV